MATKEQRLAGERPLCRRVAVGADLADDWPTVLRSSGFASSERAAWLVEGLLQYLDAAAVDTLFARIDSVSVAGSVLLYDIVGTTLMESSFLQPTLPVHGAAWRAVEVQHRRTGGPRRTPWLDRHGHRCGRARKPLAEMGAPARPTRRARCAARLLCYGHQSLTAAAEHCVKGTVTLVEKWSGTVGFGAAAMKHRSVVHLSGDDGRGDFPPDREAVNHLGTPFGCGQSVPARPKMR